MCGLEIKTTASSHPATSGLQFAPHSIPCPGAPRSPSCAGSARVILVTPSSSFVIAARTCTVMSITIKGRKCCHWPRGITAATVRLDGFHSAHCQVVHFSKSPASAPRAGALCRATGISDPDMLLED